MSEPRRPLGAPQERSAVIAGVHDPRSVGVHAYVRRLSDALLDLGIDYYPAPRSVPGAGCHFHLANSTRMIIPDAAAQRRRFLLTVHDVVPRSRALALAHRAVLLPLCLRRTARVIVHSSHAADLLRRTVAVAPDRLAVVPHPAPALHRDRAAACATLALAPGPPLFVLPGVLKAAKLVEETVRAAAPLIAQGRARLLLCGRVADESVAREAVAAGAMLLRGPDQATYDNAIVAADAVVCLRADTVGESNGPLLDAIGAGKPSLITAVGSAGEVAGASARVVEPTVAGIRAAFEALLDDGERGERARAADVLAVHLSWDAAARLHRQLLEEVTHA